MADPVINSPDMITEIQNAGGGEKGQEHLPTPAQVEQAENHLAPQLERGVPLNQVVPPVVAGQPATPPAPAPATPQTPAAPAGQQPDPAAKPPAIIPQGFDVEALAKKLEEGTALTPDEQAIAKIIELDATVNPPAPDPAAKTYKVADKVYTAEEFEMKMRAPKEEGGTGLGDLDVSKEVRDNLMNLYHTSLNRTEFSTSTTQKAEAVAHDVKKVEAARAELNLREQAVAQKELLHKQTTSSLLAEGERIKKLLEDPVYAGLTEETIKDEMGNVDVVKASRFVNKDSMQRQLTTIVSDLKKYEEAEKAILAERSTIQVQQFVELVAPQYKTEGGDIFAINERINKGDTTVSQQDRMKILELHQIFREAKETGIPASDVYELRKIQRTLAVAASAVQSAGTNGRSHVLPELKPIPRKSDAETIRRWMKKFSGASTPNGGGGGGTGDRGNALDKRPSQAIVEHDAQFAANGGADKFLEQELKGY